MATTVIQVEHLCKRYRIGAAAPPGRLSEAIHQWAVSPFRGPSGASSQAKSQAAVAEINALNDVSFTVQEGEILGIIGRNGAGKSTLLRILSRITRPTAGRVGIVGRVGSLLEVGTGFHPELTGRENVFLNGAILGLSHAAMRRRFEEIVDFAGIDGFLDTPVKWYSSGMRVRLAFSVAAHLEPEVLIVDEVLSVGDVAFQRKCLGMMENVGRSGRTALVVSHQMSMISTLCQRALYLDAGRLAADGPAGAVVQTYLAQSRVERGEVVWDDPVAAPGNHEVRLRAVRIRQADSDAPAAEVDIARETLIEIDYQNLSRGARYNVGVWLKDGLETFLFSTINATGISLADDPWYNAPHPEGLFRSTLRIPANFLNDIRYRVTVLIGHEIDQPIVKEEGVLAFDVHDTGAMRQEYSGPWVGPVIRPRFDWRTQQLETRPGPRAAS